jgi:hypothetical protein
MYKYFLFISFLLLTVTIIGQNNTYLSDSDSVSASKIIDKYLNENKSTTIDDSIFRESYTYLNYCLNSDSVQSSYYIIKNMVETNQLIKNTLELYQFRNKVDSLNKVRYKVLSNYWEQQQSITNNAKMVNVVFADSFNIGIEDSTYIANVDTIVCDTLNLDSILQVLNPYNDTLLWAIDNTIDNIQSNDLLSWIKDIRNDTIDIYLVNVNGDSLLVRLYEDSPYLIKFGLTDYWGTNIPAVIRDIKKRSFKILIDDTPEIFYQTEEKAQEAIESINKNISSPDTLSIKKIPVKIIKPKWLLGGAVRLDLSQLGTYQWAQGGDPYVSFLGEVKLFANYKHNKIGWDSRGLFRYGVIRQGRLENDPNTHIRPNEDKMEISSKYGYNVFKSYYITQDIDLKTQMGPSYDWSDDVRGDLETDFMSPAFLTFSLGVDYKPNNETSLLLAPITVKSTIVLNEMAKIKEKYNVDTTKNSREEFGARFMGRYKFNIWDNVQISNRLELFSNYLLNPQNIDINWEFSTMFPINDFIKATLLINFIYDDDTNVPKFRTEDNGDIVKYEGKGGQLKEIMTIGFFMEF